MAKKRRTKKQKIKAKHNFEFSIEAIQKSKPSQAPVKGQFIFKEKKSSSLKSASKNAKVTAKDGELSNIRHDIIRSLILTSLVLSLEVMIYLIWSK